MIENQGKTMQTTVINLFGGPGCGKSTTASSLFAHMKQLGLSVELVPEYCKQWAWGNRDRGQWDSLLFLGKQSSYESLLYGKVNFIITESPILLSGVYQSFYSSGKRTYTQRAAEAFVDHAESEGIKHMNFFLHRNVPYDPNGRWEDGETAKKIDVFTLNYLTSYACHPPIIISGSQTDKNTNILSHLLDVQYGNHPGD
jgi:hypothetical protein